MFSSLVLTTALAVAVLAGPIQHLDKRAMLTRYNMHTVTEVDVVYVHAAAPTDAGTSNDNNDNAAAAAQSSGAGQAGGYGQKKSHNGNNHGHYGYQSISAQEQPQPTTQQQQPQPTTQQQQPQPTTQQQQPQPTTQQQQPPPTYQQTSQPSPTQASPDTGSSSGNTGGADQTFINAVVNHHNVHRNNHSVPNVQWDGDMYAVALTIANSCVYKHDTKTGGGGYGQNIAAGVDQASVGNVISDMFYNGEEPIFAENGCYGKANPDMGSFESWGHFSQVVWKDTTHVACAVADCRNSPNGLQDGDGNRMDPGIPAYFTVCNYKSAGNFGGEYAKNVLPPKGDPTVLGSANLSS